MSACSSARTMLSSFSVHGDSSPRTASRPARAGLAAGALAGVALAGAAFAGCLRRCLAVLVGAVFAVLAGAAFAVFAAGVFAAGVFAAGVFAAGVFAAGVLAAGVLAAAFLTDVVVAAFAGAAALLADDLAVAFAVDLAVDLARGLHGRLRRGSWSPWTSAVDFAAFVALAGLCAAGLAVDFAVLLAFAGGLVVATPRAGLAVFAAGPRGAVLTGRASLAGADFLAGAACPVLLAISVAPFEVLIGRRGGRCGKDRRGPGGAQSPAPPRQRPGCARGGRRDAPGSRLVRVRTACQLPNGKRGGSAELEPEPLSPESDCWWAALDRVGSGEPPDAAGAGPSGPSPATGSASRSRNCPSR